MERDQPLHKWKQKVWAYEAYGGSAVLHARYQHPTLAVLGIARDAHQQRRLLQATAEALAILHKDSECRDAASERYFISHIGSTHLLTIGTGWQKLQRVTVIGRRGAVQWGCGRRHDRMCC